MPRLWQVTIRPPPQGEAAAARLLERVFGESPAVYRDEETGAIAVSVYPDRLPMPPGALRAKLEEALGRSRRRARLEVSASLGKGESGGGPPHSKTLTRVPMPSEKREASWSAPVLWSFARGDDFNRTLHRMDLGKTRVTIKPLRRENWAESWKRHFHPIEIGPRLRIRPGWSRRRVRPGQRVIVLDPGVSCGTGQHPTTLFCLRQIARCRRAGTRQALLDIGTGSGILAIAAAKLGYAPVVALECDPEAIRASRGNFRRNKVRARLWAEDLTRLPLVPARRYDVVCANLTCDLLAGQGEKIRNLVKPGGKLVVAGLWRREFEKIRKNLQQLNLTLVKCDGNDDWKSGLFALLQPVPHWRSN